VTWRRAILGAVLVIFVAVLAGACSQSSPKSHHTWRVEKSKKKPAHKTAKKHHRRSKPKHPPHAHPHGPHPHPSGGHHHHPHPHPHMSGPNGHHHPY